MYRDQNRSKFCEEGSPRFADELTGDPILVMMDTTSPFSVAMPYCDVVSTCVGEVAHCVLLTKKLRNCEARYSILRP
jgi:hypothetical protein